MFNWLYNIKRWVAYRTYNKYHIVDTKLPPNYYDKDTLLLHACFSLLEDFVEIECASMQLTPSKHERDPISGIAHLQWASNIVLDESWGVNKDNPRYGELAHQAIIAREVEELYWWWKLLRPTRPDPDDASGWSAVYNQPGWTLQTNATEGKSEALRAWEIEEGYHVEDDEMLCRLMKVRRGLWT